MIETQGLSKRFDSFLAVDGVTLTVKPGEVLALLGPNGAGKTTTVRMLTSILKPSAGWARVAGHDVVEEPAAVRTRVGVLTENPGLYFRMRSEEYLDFFGELYGLSPAARRARAVQLLERFGMADARGKRLGEYSKGMRQKLALIRALDLAASKFNEIIRTFPGTDMILFTLHECQAQQLCRHACPRCEAMPIWERLLR